MYRTSAAALYAFGLVVTLLALARGSPALGASVLVLGATMGDLRVSPKSTSKPTPKRNLLRRTLRRMGGQIVLSGFVLLDIGALGLALVVPVWLAPWVTLNLTALLIGSLSWSEDRRMRAENATATQRQAEKIRAAEQQKLEQREHEPEGKQQAEPAEGLRQPGQQPNEGEKRLLQEKTEHEAQNQQQAEHADRLRQLEQQLREAQDRLRQEAEGREAQGQQQAEQAERLRQLEQQLTQAQDRLRQEAEAREAQKQQQAEQAERLGHAEQQLREAQERQCREGKKYEALICLHAEQSERLRQAKKQLREAQERRQEEEHEALKRAHAEQAERLRQAEQQLREAQERRHREEEEREARRKSQRERAAAQFEVDWWNILGVAPSASKDEIARNFRHRIKQCHPDRVAGLAPEFLELAEEHTKVLNEAYENAMRCRRPPPLC